MTRLIIDVREPIEFVTGHVEGAINLPLTNFTQGIKNLEKVPKDTELVLYCQSGSRSAEAIKILKALGYTHLINGINKSHIERNFL